MNSTLALQKSDYESEVADFLGLGRSPTGWNADDTDRNKLDVASGLRRFYYCGHPWSFLDLFAEVTLPQGVTNVTLPDDFGGVNGGAYATLTNSSTVVLRRLMFRGPGEVQMALSSTQNATGQPQIISIRAKKNMGTGKMQVCEIFMFPETDQEYTLKFPYFATPNYLLDVTQPFAYGGVEHHETIMECCLAVAEIRRDNMIGVHAAESERLLKRSMDIDRRKNPTNLGQNSDRSDGTDWDRRWNGHGYTGNLGGVTIDGVYYS